MAEYIKRNAIKERLEDLVNWCQDLRKPGLEQALAMLNEEPVADVAPVVHCKDCKHYRNYPNGLCYLHTEPKTNASGYSGEAVCVEPDDFCSYGERKNVK